MATNSNNKFKLQQQIDKCYEQRARQLSARKPATSDEDARLKATWEAERARRRLGQQLDAELMEMESDIEWR
jgi:hypothetical protein